MQLTYFTCIAYPHITCVNRAAFRIDRRAEAYGYFYTYKQMRHAHPWAIRTILYLHGPSNIIITFC